MSHVKHFSMTQKNFIYGLDNNFINDEKGYDPTEQDTKENDKPITSIFTKISKFVDGLDKCREVSRRKNTETTKNEVGYMAASSAPKQTGGL